MWGGLRAAGVCVCEWGKVRMVGVITEMGMVKGMLEEMEQYCGNLSSWRNYVGWSNEEKEYGG